MTNNIVTKIEEIVAQGSLLSSAITTKEIELSRYKYVDFIISFSSGAVGNTVVKAMAKNGNDGTSLAISCREKLSDGITYNNISTSGKAVSIGEKSQVVVLRVTADNSAKGEYDRAFLTIDKIASSTASCSIMAVLYEPRYTE